MQNIPSCSTVKAGGMCYSVIKSLLEETYGNKNTVGEREERNLNRLKVHLVDLCQWANSVGLKVS